MSQFKNITEMLGEMRKQIDVNIEDEKHLLWEINTVLNLIDLWDKNLLDYNVYTHCNPK